MQGTEPWAVGWAPSKRCIVYATLKNIGTESLLPEIGSVSSIGPLFQ